MRAYFPVIEIKLKTGSSLQTIADEVMGSKPKFWVVRERTERRALWKEARPNSGEDWSEKVAYHIAKQLGVPCPRVDLARIGSKRGVLSWDFLRHLSPSGSVFRSTLVHGNDLLWVVDKTYPKEVRYHARRHTVEAVYDALKAFGPSAARESVAATPGAFATFIGYLLLDALIGNTDRHHENWGIELTRQQGRHIVRLAPSYDHASSLGRELDDKTRKERLEGRSKATVATYANKARSAFWSANGSRKLTPLDALSVATALEAPSFRIWLERLKLTNIKELFSFVERVPEDLLSPIGKRYAREILAHNYQRKVDLGT